MRTELAPETGTTDRRAVRHALLIALANGIGYLPFALTIPILPGHVTGRLHGGPAEVGAVISGYALTALLARPVSGVLMNRLGTRALTIGGTVLTALATVCYPLAGSITELIGLRMLLGVGMGVMLAAVGVWPVQLVAEDRQGWALGLGGTVNYVAIGLGAPLGSLIEHLVGTATTFVIAGLVALLVVPIALYVPEVRLSSTSERAGAEQGRAALLGVVLPSVALVFTAFGFAAVSSFAVAKFDALGVAGGAVVVTAYSLTVVLLRVAGSWIRWEATRPVELAGLFLVEALGVALLGTADGLGLGVVGGVLIGVGMWQIYPMLGLFVVRSVSERRRATALSTFGACFTVGLAAGSGSLGLVAGAAGYRTMFLVCAACVGLGMLVAVAAARVARID
ncbi:Predicted arabinose efflux permease, MFS family [Streptomyces sp. TLI_053]|uniref:MFS transporter n=1 Tax=Streptomyces sp. TLI_053 TaxID=1855352 RepID=UPI00087D2D54|nr:MFS transporter [Streptomyces sp. TLI_053]SDT83029.1 Predicted arabinose efflux permease, MFS family [Streptomyces sp. TLI_053]